jgi:hypothetical protein
MAGVLSFSDYIGGPDEVIAEQAFPSDQKSYRYDFGIDITGWTFTADYQTIVVNEISFNRYTGQPNFSNSNVIGTFVKAELTGNSAPQVVNASAGTVDLRIPAAMYTGPILPDARQNVPVTVVALTWATADTFAQINTHRWALVQCWEPDVVAGDPTLDAGYTAIVLGA